MLKLYKYLNEHHCSFFFQKGFQKKNEKEKKKKGNSKNSIDNVVLNKNGLDIFHLLWKDLEIFSEWKIKVSLGYQSWTIPHSLYISFTTWSWDL